MLYVRDLMHVYFEGKVGKIQGGKATCEVEVRQ